VTFGFEFTQKMRENIRHRRNSKIFDDYLFILISIKMAERSEAKSAKRGEDSHQNILYYNF